MSRPQTNPPRVVWAWLCNSCGYDMDGLGADPHTCPECGAITESFHALPRYAPTTRSLRAMSWLVLLMAVGQIVNLAFYFVVMFAGVFVADSLMLIWTAIVGSLVTCSLVPGAVVIARVDATHNEATQEIASRLRKGVFAVLRLDLEIYLPAMLRRGNWLVAIMLIGLAMEFVGIAYLTIEFEQVIQNWAGLMLTEVLIVEGLVLNTGAAGLIAQVVLERLPRYRHRILLDTCRPLFAHGLWIAVPVATVSWGGCPTVLYLCWFGMAAITLSSVVTCVFAHLTLRRTIQHVA